MPKARAGKMALRKKILLHGAFGALMGDMAGGSVPATALAGGATEYVMGYLTKEKGED